MERAGIPVAFFSAIPAIRYSMGVYRIIPGRAVTHLLGDPVMSAEQERILRRHLVLTGLRALTTGVDRPTTFQVN